MIEIRDYGDKQTLVVYTDQADIYPAINEYLAAHPEYSENDLQWYFSYLMKRLRRA